MGSMVHTFTSIITKEGRWFVAQCVELGVASQGSTLKAAEANLKEAVELYLEDSPKKLPKKFVRPLIRSLQVSHV